MTNSGDFSKGSVSSNVMGLAMPMIVAQLINVLYSIVDRMYIGHLENAAANALTGVGLTFPILSIVIAFANLFGMGGAPLFAMERGKSRGDSAGEIMGTTFAMLVLTGAALSLLILAFKRPLLYLFGASDITYPYANSYITIYLCGSVFVMIGLGMNNFINAQGFAKTGMMTILLGAVINIILDPILIFTLNMGVAGAALATIISQFASALWAILFLTSKKAPIRLPLRALKIRFVLVKNIVVLGTSGFIMAVTNSAVQIVCNATLQLYGGDLYVGVMTIINSVREVVTAPINGLTSASQPVISFNYGAKEYGRVRSAIKFMSILCIGYTPAVWLCVLLFPEVFIRVFSNDPKLVGAAIPAMHLYFFGFFMMALQMSAQTAAVALGRAKQAIFFSLLRKAFIVIPLTLILPPLFNLEVNGVFLAEPVSNFVGGGACFLTMMLTIWKEMKRLEQDQPLYRIS